MPERKIWTAEEDRILKFLIEERGLSRWSVISRVMEEQFKIMGRNGKQCRERYHNHLDKNITNSEWSRQEEELLYNMQDDIGNKWALISSKLPGRTDNCVKNHFYSKLRKSLRSINKKIHKFMKKEYREIKTTTLSKIIETLEIRCKQPNPSIEDGTYQLCKKIKNELWDHEDELNQFDDANEEIQRARAIIEDIALFDKDIKKTPRKISLISSAKFSEKDSIHKAPSYLASSTKSIYDDSSESFSNNSEIISSSSFGHRSLHSSQHLLQSHKVFLSQKIQYESESQNDSESAGPVLFMSVSANSINKSSERMPEIKQQSIKRENSVASSNSKDSRGSSKSKESNEPPQNCMYMFGEESLDMRVLSPRRLTIEEKIEIGEDSNDLLFCGEMDIENESASELIKGFSSMSLSTIPKLGKYYC